MNKYLPCPICLDGKQKLRFSELGLKYHLAWFHKRQDITGLIELAKHIESKGIEMTTDKGCTFLGPLDPAYCEPLGRTATLGDCAACLRQCPRTTRDAWAVRELEDLNAMKEAHRPRQPWQHE